MNNKDDSNWFSVSKKGSTVLQCCNCKQSVDVLYPSVDHHPSICPNCNIDCIFISWKDFMVQIAMDTAPEPLERLIRWSQADLDEYEFVTILVSIDEIASKISEEMQEEK